MTFQKVLSLKTKVALFQELPYFHRYLDWNPFYEDFLDWASLYPCHYDDMFLGYFTRHLSPEFLGHCRFYNQYEDFKFTTLFSYNHRVSKFPRLVCRFCTGTRKV